MSLNLIASKSALSACCALSAFLLCTPGLAAPTPAGTIIDNTATATFSLPNGGSDSVVSNTVRLTVDELLDVTVAWADGDDVLVQPGLTGQVLTYTVTNTGNGSEAFALTARNSLSGDDFDPTSYAIYLDTNGDGNYDPGVDQAYMAGAGDPLISADGSTTVFVVSTIGAGAADASRAGVDLIASAVSGTGTAGTTFTGVGTGGGNAVVGTSGGDGFDDGFYKVSAATVGFVKSATILDPFGGTTAVPGSTISYTLIATVSGSSTLPDLAISDPIPAGTTYVPGTLTLESGALSDASDADQGEFTGTAIAVRPGDVASGQSRTVSFKVTINN